jgi:hypothetical protein
MVIPQETPEGGDPRLIYWRTPSEEGRPVELLEAVATEGLPVLQLAANEYVKRLRRLRMTPDALERAHGIPAHLTKRHLGAAIVPDIIRHFRPEISISLRTFETHRQHFKLMFPGLLGHARERYLVDCILTFLWRSGMRPRPDPAMGPFAFKRS